jgi:hypothetical protein
MVIDIYKMLDPKNYLKLSAGNVILCMQLIWFNHMIIVCIRWFKQEYMVYQYLGFVINQRSHIAKFIS